VPVVGDVPATGRVPVRLRPAFGEGAATLDIVLQPLASPHPTRRACDEQVTHRVPALVVRR
jgi:hypothetical protein